MIDFFINKGYAAKSGDKHDYLCFFFIWTLL